MQHWMNPKAFGVLLLPPLSHSVATEINGNALTSVGARSVTKLKQQRFCLCCKRGTEKSNGFILLPVVSPNPTAASRDLLFFAPLIYCVVAVKIC